MSIEVVFSVTDAAVMDSKDLYDVVPNAFSTTAEDVRDSIRTPDNDTDRSEDRIYMLCGVLVAMVLVGVIIVLLAVTISKLRKREDQNNDVSEQPSVVQTATPAVSAIVSPTTNGQTVVDDIRNNGIVNTGATIATGELTGIATIDGNTTFVADTTTEHFIWQFPPPYPPTTPPPQYTLYNEQDTLVHGLQTADRPGFAKGIKKNIGGRWRRLVKRKSETDTCAIPPELKDQLKTIYVY